MNTGTAAPRRRWRVAVVGAGYFSQFHVQAWTGMADVDVVVSEVYPSIYKAVPASGEVKDQAQVRVTAEHFAKLDEAGKLGTVFGASKGADAEVVAVAEREEGWILGVEI